jgi:HEPN domain-containing protein
MSAENEAAAVARLFLKRAGDHLTAARVLIESGVDCTSDAACYHCVETVATSIRALLTLCDIRMPRVHDLEWLHRMLPAEFRLEIAPADLAYLSTYGIDRWWEPDCAQAERAYSIASESLELAKRKAGI